MRRSAADFLVESSRAYMLKMTPLLHRPTGDVPLAIDLHWCLIVRLPQYRFFALHWLLMGDSPTGYAIFTAEGRVMFVLTGEGRKPPQTVQDRADLLNSMAAYTGMYRLEGNKWITKVDVAWNPEWVGTEQTRFFKLDGERLHVTSTWRIMPNWVDKGMQRSLLVFEKSN
jgi:hypothetical protein